MARSRIRVRVAVDEVERRPAARRYAVMPTVTVIGSRDLPSAITTGLPQDRYRSAGLFDSPVSSLSPAVRSLVTQSEDRRYMQGDAPARSLRRAAAYGARRPRVRGRTISPPSHMAWEALWFKYPAHALVCVRRKRRRQVLFARGSTGRNKYRRRPRWTEYSHVRC